MSTWNLPPGVTTNNEHINPKPEQPLRTYTIFRERVRLHPGCRDSFREDRKHGLIYGPYSVDGQIMGVGPASIAADFCAYCG